MTIASFVRHACTGVLSWCAAAGLGLPAAPAHAASFDVLDLYAASGVNGNVSLIDRLGDHLPAASVVFTARYTLTVADVDAGGLSNAAEAIATPPGAAPIRDLVDDGDDADGNVEDDPTTIAFAPAGAIALVKTAVLNDDDGTPGVSAGDSIDYAFAVSNTGAATLTDISVTDPMVAVSGGPLASLAPDAVDASTFRARYIVTEADVRAGIVRNQATTAGLVGTTVSAADASGAAFDNDEETVTFLGSIAGAVADMTGPRSGALVRLVESGSGALIEEIRTDAAGRYAFIGIAPGDFCIEFLHGATESVVASRGTAETAASDGDRVCGIAIALGAGRTITDVDAIMVDPSGVIYDAVTRSPLAGATVTLMFGGAPVPDSWLGAAGDRNGVVTARKAWCTTMSRSTPRGSRPRCS